MCAADSRRLTAETIFGLLFASDDVASWMQAMATLMAVPTEEVDDPQLPLCNTVAQDDPGIALPGH
jgi:hypothetical protein